MIILLSSLIIYYYPHSNTVYNNNGESINVKYFSVGYTFPYNKHNYSLSSHFSNGNRESYLNSTIINPVVLPYNCGSVEFNMNISTHNVNDKYVYVTIIGKHVGFNPFTNQSYCKITSGEQIVKLKNSNRIYECLSSDYVDRNTVGNYYNFTLTVSAGKLHNTFNIHTEKESAIYGTVGLKPGCSDGNHNYNVSYNSTMFVYNINTSSFKIVNIQNGQFYFFTNPGDWYKIYYLNGENLSMFKDNSANNITIIKMPSRMISEEYYIYE